MSLQTLNRGKGVLRIQLPASLGGPLGGPQEGRRGEQGCAGCSSSFPTLPSPSSVFFFFGKKRASGFRRPQHLLSPFVDQSRAQARPPRLLRPRAAARSAGRCWGSSRRFLAGGPAAAPARRNGAPPARSRRWFLRAASGRVCFSASRAVSLPGVPSRCLQVQRTLRQAALGTRRPGGPGRLCRRGWARCGRARRGPARRGGFGDFGAGRAGGGGLAREGLRSELLLSNTRFRFLVCAS